MKISRNSDAKGYRGSLAVKRTDRRRRGARKKMCPTEYNQKPVGRVLQSRIAQIGIEY